LVSTIQGQENEKRSQNTTEEQEHLQQQLQAKEDLT
jgi:hypothetical protein